MIVLTLAPDAEQVSRGGVHLIIVGAEEVRDGETARPSQLNPVLGQLEMRGQLMGAGILLFLVQVVGASAQEQSVPFSDRIRVEKIADSIWWHCELVVNVDSSGFGTAGVDCKYPKRAIKRERALQDRQVSELRELLREADLFEGQFWGRDGRGWDAALVTLTVVDGERIATLVCSGNKTFDAGARRRWVRFLSEIQETVEKTQ